jgi:hypothetical protein
MSGERRPPEADPLLAEMANGEKQYYETQIV